MRLRTTLFRAHNPRWSFEPVSGKGAALYGGRFNLVKVEALYTSRRMETAWLEAQQGFAGKTQPLTICSYDVDCDNIVNLTDRDELRRLGISYSDLKCPWEDMVDRGLTPPTWTLAKQLISAGANGISVQSFARGADSDRDINVVFWKWTNRLPNKVVVIDDEQRLPRNDSSWR